MRCKIKLTKQTESSSSKAEKDKESMEEDLQIKRVRLVEEEKEGEGKGKGEMEFIKRIVFGKKEEEEEERPRAEAAAPLPSIRVEPPIYVSDEVEVTLEFLQTVVKLSKRNAEAAFPILQECGVDQVKTLLGFASEEALEQKVRIVNEDTQKVEKKLNVGTINDFWQFISTQQQLRREASRPPQKKVRIVDEDTQKVKKRLLPGVVSGLWQFISTQHSIEFVQGEVARNLVGEALNALPGLEELSNRFNRPIHAFFPVDAAVVQSARALYEQQRGKPWHDIPTRFSFLESSPNRRVDPQHLRIDPVFVDARGIIGGQSEDATHGVISPLVQYFLSGLLNLTNPVWFSEVRFARNESENKRSRTTIESLRPDWMLLIRQLLVIRGEEKGDSSGVTIWQTADELTSKMEAWNPLFFGELPYVFGYALAGTSFQFYALHPDSSIHHLGGACGVRKTPIGRLLDLSFLDERFVLLQYMINLVRVLQVMEPLVPRDAPPLGDLQTPWKRPDSGEYSRIVFEPGFVIKTLVSLSICPVQYDFDLLEKLYAKVKAGVIRNTIRCKDGYPKRTRAGNLILHLFPVGLPVLPKDAEVLGICLLDVLAALADLHACGFCHRDVRWPNILRNVDQSWMLIDLDFAAKLDDANEADWPTWTRGVPTRNGEERWSPHHDVIQVSKLLTGLLWFGPRHTLATDIAKCATAEAALNVVHAYKFKIEG